jgi:large subunit ribosomal protein L18
MIQKFRRKRQGRTDYRKRLALLKSGLTRFVVRKTNKNIIVQFVDYHDKGDKSIITVVSGSLRKYGWKGASRNIPAAYLSGLLVGIKARKKKISKAIFDIGFHPSIKGSLIYAALKGVLDAGIEIPSSENIFPDEKRLVGEHIVSNEKTKYTKSERKNIVSNFEEVKNKILELENEKQNRG